jgi:hypothetical protein
MINMSIAGNTGGPKEVLQWDDFDYSQTLHLGFSESTSVVYRKNTFEPTVIRSTSKVSYNKVKRGLVEMTRAHLNLKSFMLTVCVIKYSSKIFVGSELSDISLAEMIDYTISFLECHLSAILSQVRRFD